MDLLKKGFISKQNPPTPITPKSQPGPTLIHVTNLDPGRISAKLSRIDCANRHIYVIFARLFLENIEQI